MTVMERVAVLKDNNFIVTHKALGNEQLLSDDWFRIRQYHENQNTYSEFLFTCDIKDIDTLPKEFLEKTVLKEEVWMNGGNLSLDLFVEK